VKAIEEDLTFPDIKGLFLLYVQGNCPSIYNIISNLYTIISWHDPIKLLAFMFYLQKELVAIIDMVVKLIVKTFPKKVTDLLQRRRN